VTVPARQVTPSLLQVEAILVRLRGDALAQELCRFLHAEIASYGWVGVYRPGEPEATLVASDGGLPTSDGTRVGDPALADQAVRDQRPQTLSVPGAPPQLAVPIVVERQAVGALAVLASGGVALDGSDRRFLEDVARRVGPAFAGPSGPRLL
jgi:GAF domain-containing protein